MRTVSPERWRRIEELLDGALDLPPDHRAGWLAAECGEDESLREAVAALLAAAEQPTRLPRSPADLAIPLLSELGADGPPIPAPERAGPWRILSRLGEGGMGTVYLAERDDDQFRMTAAVKLLRGGLAGDELVRRFLHERQVLATLDHPNIARLLDGGITGGSPYLVMEYVDGVPLDQYCRERDLPVAARLRLFADVCAAVQYAHQNFVVHRDLKPSNILVTAAGTVKLLDFGISKLLDDAAMPDTATMTRTGMRLMTPEYAAPEQVRGGRITAATDVYALGVVLYEMLVGQRPYDLAGRTPSEVERVICETDPPRPSTAAARAGTGRGSDVLRRRLRGDLDTIVLKALRKEPDRRYPSAAALLEDIRRYQDRLPVRARPDTFAYRAWKFADRHRLSVAAVLVFAAVVIGAVVRERGLRERAEAEAAKAAAVKDLLVGVFGSADPYGLSPERARSLTAQQLLDRGRAGIDTALAGEPEVQAEMLSVLGGVYAGLGLFTDAAPLLERSLEALVEIHGPRDSAVAAAMTALGDVYLGLNRYDEAEPLLREALAVRRELHGNESAEAAYSLDRLATLYQQDSRYAEAEPLFRNALDLRLRLLGPDHVDVSESMANLALLLWWNGDYATADSLVTRAVEIRQARLGARHPLVAEAMHNLAQIAHMRGQQERAAALFSESLAMKREAFGNAHPSVTVHLNNYARLLREMNRSAEAEPLAREALALDREIFGAEHSYVAASLDNLAFTLADLGSFEEADSLFGQALAINRKLLGERHTMVAYNLNNIGIVRFRRGDLAGADTVFRESLSQYTEFFGADNLSPAALSGNLAGVLREQGNLAEAERLYRTALARFEAGMPETRARLAPALAGFGMALIRAGRADTAAALLERGLALSVEQFGENDWRTAEARLALGLCRHALGDRTAALQLVRESRAALAPYRTRQPRLAQQADAAWRSVAGAGG